jgi:hypothetical protein
MYLQNYYYRSYYYYYYYYYYKKVTFLNLGAIWGGWSTPRSGRLNPRERPGTHCIGGWVGPRAGLDGCEKPHPPPGFDPRTVQSVESRYTDCAIPAHYYYYYYYYYKKLLLLLLLLLFRFIYVLTQQP